jgi:hypothetical protein
LAPRGERNVLITSLDALLRVASNPFFPYLVERIQEGIDHPASTSAAVGAASVAPGKGNAVAPSPNGTATILPWTYDPIDDPADLPP